MKKAAKRSASTSTDTASTLAAFRQKAAEAALHWVVSHRTRVNEFKRSVKGTALEKPVSALLELIEAEAGRSGGSAAKPAAKKRSSARRGAARKRAAR